MSSLLARQEEQGKEPEITLSTTSLLGLFLGLVLICGVFFGFGYSVGRRSAAGVANNPAPSTEEVRATEHQSPAPSDAPALPGPEDAPVEKPPASTQPAPVTLPVVEAPTVPGPKAQADAPIAPKPQKQQTKPSNSQPAAVPPKTGHALVQVAAVVHQEDADVLVSALRRRGFNAVVRNEPQDKLLHVQVGPFNSRAEANAMRQKLLSDGYNAIIKQ